MHDFEDVAELQHQLERLSGRELACLLPRQSGQREDRYMHLLGSADDLQAALSARPTERHDSQPDSRYEQLEARIAALEERLARLEVVESSTDN